MWALGGCSSSCEIHSICIDKPPKIQYNRNYSRSIRFKFFSGLGYLHNKVQDFSYSIIYTQSWSVNITTIITAVIRATEVLFIVGVGVGARAGAIWARGVIASRALSSLQPHALKWHPPEAWAIIIVVTSFVNTSATYTSTIHNMD